MAKQNKGPEKKLEELWTGWRGILLGEKAAAEPEKEPLPTGWRGFIEREEKKRREK